MATLARLGAESLARVAGALAVRELAARDPLTGLANRSTFADGLREEVARAAEHPTAVIFCDVDAFKAVNDERGHLCGDAVLVVVARRLAAVARQGDLVARLGGDEFAVLLPAAGAQEARVVAARLQLAMVAPVVVAGCELRVRMSVGVGATDELFHGDGAAPDRSLEEALLDAADRAMYADKRAARAATAPSSQGAVR